MEGIKSVGGLTKDPNFLVNNSIFMLFETSLVFVICSYVIWEFTVNKNY